MTSVARFYNDPVEETFARRASAELRKFILFSLSLKESIKLRRKSLISFFRTRREHKLFSFVEIKEYRK